MKKVSDCANLLIEIGGPPGALLSSESLSSSVFAVLKSFKVT